MTKKLYLDNPYLRQTTARILNKEIKNNKYLLTLDRTIFFPHLSGGQPRDFGTIDGNEVINTYTDNLEIIHVLEESLENETVELNINWKNRFDLMQQHTGQHILSAAFHDLFDIETKGFHIGEKYVTIDLKTPTLKEKNFLQAETLANKIIQSNFKVTSSFIKREDLEGNLDIDISKVPEEDKDIRIININGIDASPSNGTHVSSTGEIGLIKISKIEKYKGNIRLSFLCGNKALEDYSFKDKSIREIALSLSVGTEDVVESFFSLKEEKERLEKEIKDLKNELLSVKNELE